MSEATAVRVLASNFEEIATLLSSLAPQGLELIAHQPAYGVAEAADTDRPEAYLLVFASSVDRALLETMPNLRFIQLLSAGADAIDLEAVRSRSIRIADNNGTNASTVADHTLCLLLGALRGIRFAHENTRSGAWQGGRMQITHLSELGKKTVGVVGLGRIGSKVAARVEAFDAKVAFYDIADVSAPARYRRCASLEELLTSSDVVTLHVPLTRETRHLMNRRTISCCKPGALLVNTSRGAVIETEALIEALQDGRLGRAALDVFEGEPHVPPALAALDSVLLSPHRAGSSSESWVARISFAYENILRVAAGGCPQSELR